MKSHQPTLSFELDRGELGKGKILVFDEIISKSEARKISKAALTIKKTRKKTPGFAFHRILNTEDFARNTVTSRLDAVARNLMLEYFPQTARSAHSLSHPAINVITSQATSDVHVDTTHCPECVTCLMFGNEFWNSDWGGEIVFYDEKMEAVFAVTPKPGRLVYYHANIFHRAGVPHSNSPQSRITVGVWYRCKPNVKSASLQRKRKPR